jgi:hypothetical protein
VQLCFDFYMIEAKPENLIGDRTYDSDRLDEAMRQDHPNDRAASFQSNQAAPPSALLLHSLNCESKFYLVSIIASFSGVSHSRHLNPPLTQSNGIAGVRIHLVQNSPSDFRKFGSRASTLISAAAIRTTASLMSRCNGSWMRRPSSDCDTIRTSELNTTIESTPTANNIIRVRDSPDIIATVRAIWIACATTSTMALLSGVCRSTTAYWSAFVDGRSPMRRSAFRIV